MSKLDNLRIGKLGEDIACRYLKGKGFTIISRNYSRKWGEIDIVSQKKSRTHFVEVKSSRDCETIVRPEENLHDSKITKLFRVFESYANEKGTSLNDPNFDWQFDALIVFIDKESKNARIKYIENIVMS